jgi:hypothetical protein
MAVNVLPSVRDSVVLPATQGSRPGLFMCRPEGAGRKQVPDVLPARYLPKPVSESRVSPQTDGIAYTVVSDWGAAGAGVP